MRVAFIVVLIGALGSFSGQSELWEKVGGYKPLHLKIYAASPADLVSVKKALVARVGLDNWPCAEEEDTGWTKNLRVEELLVAEGEKIVMVEAGDG